MKKIQQTDKDKEINILIGIKIGIQKITSIILMMALINLNIYPIFAQEAPLAPAPPQQVQQAQETVAPQEVQQSEQTEAPQQVQGQDVQTENAGQSEGDNGNVSGSENSENIVQNEGVENSTDANSTSQNSPPTAQSREDSSNPIEINQGFYSSGSSTKSGSTNANNDTDLTDETRNNQLVNANNQQNSANSLENTGTDGEDGGFLDDLNDGKLPTGTSTIQTGNAASIANILNTTNTNLLNSTGSLILANIFGANSDLDFRSGTNTMNNGRCTLTSCNGITDTKVNIDVDSDIDNKILLDADTGTNTVSIVEEGIINTGNSFTGLNLLNLANTNIIDSNYLMVSFNSFDTVNGDIILPSLSNIFNLPLFNKSQLTNLNTNNLADVVNDVNIDAEAGQNSTQDSFESSINTGESLTATNVYNTLNSVLAGGSSVSLLLRVSGTWVGELLGLPEGIVFIQDGSSRILEYENDTVRGYSTESTLDVNATNTARINNEIDMFSNTGKNLIKDTKKAIINTGDALSAANIINIANTNVISRNWVLAIVNIFGDFNGNLAFGRPDLWIGTNVMNNGQIKNGSEITYNMTVTNKGDSVSSNSVLNSVYDLDNLDITGSSDPFTETVPGNLAFNLGNMGPNETKQVSFTAVVKNAGQGERITNNTEVSQRETDNNYADNRDMSVVTTYAPGGGGGQIIVVVPIDSQQTEMQNVPPVESLGTTTSTTTETKEVKAEEKKIEEKIASIWVERKTAQINLAGKSKVEQVLILKNLKNESIYNAKFEDIMFDPDGKEIKSETWDLGEILPNEEITLTYNVSFQDSAAAGPYTLASEFTYENNMKLYFDKNGMVNYMSNWASGDAPVIAGSIGKPATNIENVLGAMIAVTETPVASAGPAMSTAENLEGQKEDYYTMLSTFLFITSSMYMFVRRRGINQAEKGEFPERS